MELVFISVRLESKFACENPTSTIECSLLLTLSKTIVLDSSKLKEFADNNFRFGKNGRKF